tara:strand:- start:138 stop:821 length:684 start_codon:yes stop_codon:yes gene_type:complete
MEKNEWDVPVNALHPKAHHTGREIIIHNPTSATPLANWSLQDSISIATPGGAVPEQINNVVLTPWLDAPVTRAGWEHLSTQSASFDEPDFIVPHGLKPAAGAVIVELDSRVWLAHPTNQFAGYSATFPKGTIDEGYSYRATAIKECFEETGLQVRIIGWLGDFVRSASYTRYYLAERTGGSPADMGWESQAVSLTPTPLLKTVATSPMDQPILDQLSQYLRLKNHGV